MTELGNVNESKFSDMDPLEFSSYIKQGFIEILKNESLLSDLDPEISLNELKNILSLEHGESMKVFIRRADNKVISNPQNYFYFIYNGLNKKKIPTRKGVILKQDANVGDLKEAIKNYFKLKNKRDPCSITSAINWKHVWKVNCLKFDDEKLLDNKKSLRDYGIKNKSELRFFRNSFKKI